MKGEQRRLDRWIAVLVDDPWRKLLAIALAVMLWFFISSRINDSTTRTVPLVIVGPNAVGGTAAQRLAVVLPTDRVVGLDFLDGERRIDKVDVIVSGPRFRIAAIEDQPLDLQVTAFLGREWGQRTTVEFTAADVRRDLLSLRDLTIRLRPDRIRLDVERIAELAVPLSLEQVELQEGQLAGRLRRETAEFAPATAIVLGKAFGIDQLQKRGGRMFRATMEGVGNERQVSAPLELIGAQELGLRFAQTPQVTMQVRPQTWPFDVVLPVIVDDQALPAELRGVYQPLEKTMAVRIRAGGALRSRLVNLGEGEDKSRMLEWAAANLRLLVHLPRLEPGQTYLPEVDRLPRLLLVGSLFETVDRQELALDQSVVVKLRRTR